MHANSHSRYSQLRIKLSNLIIFAFLAFLFLYPVNVCARPMNKGQAAKVVRGWLRADAQPLGMGLGRKIMKVETFSDDKGRPIYYVVYLQPSGFVIVSADDLVEPIIAFVARGSYDPSLNNPLGALVSGDLVNRIAAARSLGTSAKPGRQKRAALGNASLKSQDKWIKFSGSEIEVAGASSISDVWVEPLLQSTWGQTTIGSYAGGTTC